MPKQVMPTRARLALTGALLFGIVVAVGASLLRAQYREAARAQTLDMLRTAIEARIALGLPVLDGDCQGHQCFEFQVRAPSTVRWDSSQCRLTLIEESFFEQEEDSVVVSLDRPVNRLSDTPCVK